MNLFKRLTNFKLLLVIFALSFLLRLPNLNRPLANQWELCTGISLVQLDIWQRTGAQNFHYLLPVNYPGVKELHIQNWKAYKQATDSKGDYYYLSFPPFYLLVPYFLNQFFAFPISPLSLQLLNIFLHLITLLLILKTSQLIFPSKSNRINSIGIIACLIYTFSPSPLWFHTNIYLNFPFVIPIILLSNYLFLKIHLAEKNKLLRHFFLGIALAMLCYTEWVGFLSAFTYFSIAAYLFYRNRQSKYLTIMVTVTCAAIFTLGFFLYQCAAAVGWEKLINYFFYKYDEYSGPAQGSHFLIFLSRLFLWYTRGYGPILTILAGLLVFLWVKRYSIRMLISNNVRLLFAILIIPSFLRHLIIREYTVHHEYSTLIDGLTFSFLGGILINYIIENQFINKKYLKNLGVLFLVTNSISFFLQHFPGSHSYNGYPYNVAQKIGTNINKHTIKNEAVFLVGYNREYEWQLLWYAKTNVGFCKNFEELNAKMKELNLSKAKAFVLAPSYMHTGKIDYIKEITTTIK